ncbi:MAG: hypothetical protein AB7G23_03530 [Vicinamibacterales bacterium]
MTLADTEYAALRTTIASRGTARIVLVPVTIAAWAALGAALVLGDAPPVATVFPLSVLVAGFEAVHALHAGVERIGRYLQVYYESAPGAPRWETTAMAVGPALPGGGIDPLFSLVFGGAALANLLPLLRPDGLDLPGVVVLLLHAAYLLRLTRARAAAARQRAVELESFRAVRNQQAGG